MKASIHLLLLILTLTSKVAAAAPLPESQAWYNKLRNSVGIKDPLLFKAFTWSIGLDPDEDLSRFLGLKIRSCQYKNEGKIWNERGLSRCLFQQFVHGFNKEGITGHVRAFIENAVNPKAEPIEVWVLLKAISLKDAARKDRSLLDFIRDHYRNAYMVMVFPKPVPAAYWLGAKLTGAVSLDLGPRTNSKSVGDALEMSAGLPQEPIRRIEFSSEKMEGLIQPSDEARQDWLPMDIDLRAVVRFFTAGEEEPVKTLRFDSDFGLCKLFDLLRTSSVTNALLYGPYRLCREPDINFRAEFQ